MIGVEIAGIVLLQQVPPRALIVAMLISYTLCFAGMIFAYLSWRRRRRGAGKQSEERKP